MEPVENFLNPRLRADWIDGYINRRAILGALTAVLPSFHGTVLDIGCGQKPYRSLIVASPSRANRYIVMDFPDSTYGAPDLGWDGTTIPLDDGSVECVMATEVLEHCIQPRQLLSEAKRVLKPGGFFFMTAPFLWPLHCVPHDQYRYTPFALEWLLKDAGFGQVVVRAGGGWDSSLAQMIGLWVSRRPMPTWKRTLLSRLAVPAVRGLLRRDIVPDKFWESTMVNSLSATAVKPGAVKCAEETR